MKERLAKFIKNEELSPSRFAEIMGVPPSSISHLLSGRNNPGFDFLSKMLMRFPKVNPDWLILGTGQMYRTGGTTSDVATPSPMVPSNAVEIPEFNFAQRSEELSASVSANIPDAITPFASDGPSLFNGELAQPFARINPEQLAESIHPEPDHAPAVPKQTPVIPNDSRPAVTEASPRAAATSQTAQEQIRVYKSVAKVYEKEIDRIIIFFGDGTFRSYVNSPDGQ